MPAQTYQIPNGSRVLLFSCESCGSPACFGFNCDVRAAMAAKTKADGTRLAGKWWCGRLPNGDGYCKVTGETSGE